MLEKRKEYRQFKYLKEIEYITLFFALFLIPLLFGEPQLLVGTVVNAVLIYSTLRFGFKNTIPFLVLPSCMSYLRGILFRNLTIFLIYLIPFIILSNGIFSFTVSKVKSNVLSILLGSIFKAGFLYLIANIFVKTISLPNIFLTTMGINQLITAVAGGLIGYMLYFKAKK